jgi:rhodanese-related sulfurtransferase
MPPAGQPLLDSVKRRVAFPPMSDGEQASAQDIHLSPPRASELVAEGAQLIDVRTEHEWDAGRIAGAKRIELGELGGRAGELESGRTVVFYCRGGNRSAMATQAFREAGYDAHNIEGGLAAWAEAGLPLEPEQGYVAESGEAAAVLEARRRASGS